MYFSTFVICLILSLLASSFFIFSPFWSNIMFGFSDSWCTLHFAWTWTYSSSLFPYTRALGRVKSGKPICNKGEKVHKHNHIHDITTHRSWSSIHTKRCFLRIFIQSTLLRFDSILTSQSSYYVCGYIIIIVCVFEKIPQMNDFNHSMIFDSLLILWNGKVKNGFSIA